MTVLFADLAGSTALGERLDPEDVRVVQGELFALVNAEVERFGGVTEKFVGDAVHGRLRRPAGARGRSRARRRRGARAQRALRRVRGADRTTRTASTSGCGSASTPARSSRAATRPRAAS